jgi:hypothetical protein
MLQKQLQILLLLVHGVAFCQSEVKCDSAYTYLDSLRTNAIGLMRYDKAPQLIGSRDVLYLDTTDSLKTGKIYVEFLIDTQGKARCARVIMSQKMDLNDRAIRLIEGLNYLPGEQRGLRLMSTMILPVAFGKRKLH